MRKAVVLLLVAIIGLFTFVACNPESSLNDELVSVTLSSESNTRSLTVTSDFDIETIKTWKYTAIKADNGLKTGETRVQVELKDGKTEQLSQGSWNFALFGYNADDDLVCSGSVDNKTITTTNNSVSITVGPLQTEGGEGSIHILSDIALVDAKGNKFEEKEGSLTYVKKIYLYDSTEALKTTTNNDVTLDGVASGIYFVKVEYIANANDGTEYVAASGTKYFNVYDNLTTIISGTIEESTTAADVSFNDGIVQVTKKAELFASSESNLNVLASPLETGNEDAMTSITIPANSLDADTNVDFSLIVYPAEVASSSEKFAATSGNSVVAGLDITLKNGDTEIKSFKDNSITVVTYIAKNLEDVEVKYNGDGEQPTLLNYDKNTGRLEFTTTHLSEYYVTSSSVALNDENNAFSSLESAFKNTSSKGTIMLLSDTSSKSQIKLDNKDLTFDLNGKTLTFTSDVTSSAIVVSNGTLNILDSSDVLGRVIYSGKSAIINAIDGSEVNVDGGNYESKYLGLSVNYGGVLTISNPNVSVKAQEFSLSVYRNSTLNVEGGTFTSLDNAIIGTAGNKELGGFTINITGGTFNGNIQSTGYIANGIYMANTGTVNIENATFNITDGIGILVRSGSLNLGKNVIINCTKDKLDSGKVGDSKEYISSPSEICIDRKANYPGDAPAVITNESNYNIKFEDGSDSGVKTKKGTKTQDELLSALNSSVDYVFLTNDLDINSTVYTNQEVVLDLNGKTITNSKDIWDTEANNWSLISVRENGNLTITGNGHLLAKDDDCYGLDVDDGASLTIENGEIKGNIHAIYVQKGQLTVNGGKYYIHQTYPDKQKAYGFVLNCYDENRENGTAKIVVKGGMFDKFNPADNWAEGEHTNFLAEGYKSTLSGEWYEVSAN